VVCDDDSDEEDASEESEFEICPENEDDDEVYMVSCSFRTTLECSVCWGSVTFWCESGSADSYLRLKDPDLTLAPTPFFSALRMQKIRYFFIFFSNNLPAGTLSSF
jgi:hypothetical protein